MLINFLKSLLHNIGVLIVGFGLAFVATKLDGIFRINDFRTLFTAVAGCLLLTVGFFLRTWATFHFYMRGIKVISLAPQKALITTGPYKFSRNPLYLGGNVFIFFGAALLLGSPTGLFLTAIHLPFIDIFIRREEKQLEQKFGQDWVRYKNKAPRWI